MSDWIGVPSDYQEYQGFVYIISNKLENKYYIGKKFFKSKKVRKPLKGNKNKRHYTKESDWKDYWGSNPELLADVKNLGEENFNRMILSCHKTKFDCSYEELREQVTRNVLFRPEYYNQIVNVRLRKRK